MDSFKYESQEKKNTSKWHTILQYRNKRDEWYGDLIYDIFCRLLYCGIFIFGCALCWCSHLAHMCATGFEYFSSIFWGGSWVG